MSAPGAAETRAPKKATKRTMENCISDRFGVVEQSLLRLVLRGIDVAVNSSEEMKTAMKPTHLTVFTSRIHMTFFELRERRPRFEPSRNGSQIIKIHRQWGFQIKIKEWSGLDLLLPSSRSHWTMNSNKSRSARPSNTIWLEHLTRWPSAYYLMTVLLEQSI